MTLGRFISIQCAFNAVRLMASKAGLGARFVFWILFGLESGSQDRHRQKLGGTGQRQSRLWPCLQQHLSPRSFVWHRHLSSDPLPALNQVPAGSLQHLHASADATMRTFNPTAGHAQAATQLTRCTRTCKSKRQARQALRNPQDEHKRWAPWTL